MDLMREEIMSPQFELLFSPFMLCSVEVKNRIIMSPTAGRRVLSSLPPDQATTDYLVRRARGGVGAIIMRATTFCRMDIADTRDPATGFYRALFEQNLDRYRDLLAQLRSYGAKVGTQLSHIGPEAVGHVGGYEPVGPSPIARSPKTPPPRQLTGIEIKNLVNRYAHSVGLAKEAGFDFVELHMGHGYLISRFLSQATNTRKDDYGGSLENRARFAVEILTSARSQVGPDFPISCRFNGSDNVKEGFSLAEARQVAAMLAHGGASLLNISGGIYGSLPLTVVSYFSPRACYASLAEEIKGAVTIPVAVAGRINDPVLAEEILAHGQADLITMGRPLCADPDLPAKASKGNTKGIRKCIACNVCIDTFWEGRDVCTVNPALGREAEFVERPARKRKKVMVVGGGLAGMEAAWITASRGHDVTLFEASDRLGGQWLLASVAPHKEGFACLLEHLAFQLTQSGVRVRLGEPVTRQRVTEEAPDEVIIATGAQPTFPRIPGLDQENVFTAWDILSGKKKAGDKVLIVGGGSTGLEVAHLLSQQNKEVTVIEMCERAGTDMGATIRWILLNKLRDEGVHLLTNTRLLRLSDGNAVVEQGDGERTLNGYDTVIMATGTASCRSLAASLKGMSLRIHVIGDSAAPGRAVDAIRSAAEVGNRV
jgi:2,4-dienoyl-CoA reductase-like NADH-dependent reductase (Old Yellow Enzyme family)/thioredoxin reductase